MILTTEVTGNTHCMKSLVLVPVGHVLYDLRAPQANLPNYKEKLLINFNELAGISVVN